MQHVAVAQLGARMHYAVPEILHRSGCLERLYTDICAVKGWPRLLSAIPPGLRSKGIQRLQERFPKEIPPELIVAFTNFGYEYAWRLRKARTATEMTSAFLWAGSQFNQLIIQRGFGNASLVYGYNSASEEMFAFAKKQGLRTILEQTIAPKCVETRLLLEEVSYANGWGGSICDDLADKFAARESLEWELADTIICGSEFVRQNVIAEGALPEKCIVIPYGVNLSNIIHSTPKIHKRSEQDPLQVIFVGRVGLRKGVYYLLEAMRQLEGLPIKCRVIGGLSVDPHLIYQDLPSNVELVGSIPRSKVVQEYARADVFCFPSLCEGSATVTYEALSAGLPVITTHNSGSIIRDGIEGFIVPIRDSSSIAERLESLLRDPDRLEEMSSKAVERSEYGSLDSYASRLLATISGI